MKTSEFAYDLPKELIAQVPLQNRPESRLLVLDKNTGAYEDKHFYDILDELHEGDVLVRNNTRVIPARLFGVKEGTGAHVEVLLLKQDGDVWECLCGNARVIKLGTVIDFGEGRLKAKCVGIGDKGVRKMEMLYNGVFMEILDELGNVPLPPYIREKLEDKERYQTVYAKYEGSAAAPTAGLHFTTELFDQLRDKGVEILDVTLHIGLGTFRPVNEEDILDHEMHSEWYHMDQKTADALNKARAEGRRIIAVGTTSVRTLESVAQKFNGVFREDTDETSIFIYPGYKWLCVDALITNFHLPESTLIMLVCSFAGKENVLRAYEHAVKEKYRFFSFGDAMFIR
ncbi:MAG: tRNA preQ1(34) S-adenosylmethionine ribosyltransferase-isomerase QueA [Erysipelotrichales bacterium]|nr:tRNA preQ1(34) S-adenosylmethionine ribosyltransferase-isomerase QueA [Erysipelotrichales bacterium]